jgi:hypothetical protein
LLFCFLKEYIFNLFSLKPILIIVIHLSLRPLLHGRLLSPIKLVAGLTFGCPAESDARLLLYSPDLGVRQRRPLQVIDLLFLIAHPIVPLKVVPRVVGDVLVQVPVVNFSAVFPDRLRRDDFRRLMPGLYLFGGSHVGSPELAGLESLPRDLRFSMARLGLRCPRVVRVDPRRRFPGRYRLDLVRRFAARPYRRFVSPVELGRAHESSSGVLPHGGSERRLRGGHNPVVPLVLGFLPPGVVVLGIRAVLPGLVLSSVL